MLNILSFFEETAVTIDWALVGISVAIAAGIALVLAVLIVVLSKVCKVEEDARIGQVNELLAGANCGGCGYPGCSGFAKALVEGNAELSACGQTSCENVKKIADILGVDAGSGVETVVVVGCIGGDQCNNDYQYVGEKDCLSQNILMGGCKSCKEGCLGDGTCAKACPYGAIKVENGVAHVDVELCRSCGVCINTCPKSLMKRVPKNAKVYIACSSHCRGKEVMGQCKVGCIASGICAKNCPSGAITMVNNLPVIDYTKCTNCGLCLEKCPRKCIKYIHE